MIRKFYTSYVRDSLSNDEKIFDNTMVLIDVPENGEKQIPVLLQRKLSKEINDKVNGRFFPVTLINFWEVE